MRSFIPLTIAGIMAMTSFSADFGDKKGNQLIIMKRGGDGVNASSKIYSYHKASSLLTIYENIAFQPMYAAAQLLGDSAIVTDWDMETKTAYIHRKQDPPEKGIIITLEESKMLVNGEEAPLSTAAVEQNGRIYLPLQDLYTAFQVPEEEVFHPETLTMLPSSFNAVRTNVAVQNAPPISRTVYLYYKL